MACEWHSAPLGELISYIGKGVAPKYINDGPDATMVLGQKCVRNQALQYEQARFHNSAEKAVNPDKEVRKGDILVNATGVGSAGRVAQVMADPSRQCITDGHVITLRAKDINPFYLGYFVKSKQNTIELMAEGSTGQTEMNRQRLQNEIIVTFPESKDLQKRIAEYGLAIDKKIAVNNQLNDYLLDLLKSSAKNLYLKHEKNIQEKLPSGWRWVSIGEIADMVCRGIAPKYSLESDEIILGQTCIRNNLVLTENGRSHAPKKLTDKWLRKYDLLINSTGVGSLGRTAQVWFEPSKLVVDSHVTIVRATDKKNALYLGSWAFEHERYIESLHTGSTGQTELPRDRVKAIRVVLPDAGTLDEFNAIAEPSVKMIVANQEENKRLIEIRDTLLPKLMSGAIDVSKVDLTQLTNNHLSGCGSFCSVCCPSGLASEFHEWFREHFFFGYGHLCKADLG